MAITVYLYWPAVLTCQKMSRRANVPAHSQMGVI